MRMTGLCCPHLNVIFMKAAKRETEQRKVNYVAPESLLWDKKGLVSIKHHKLIAVKIKQPFLMFNNTKIT